MSRSRRTLQQKKNCSVRAFDGAIAVHCSVCMSYRDGVAFAIYKPLTGMKRVGLLNEYDNEQRQRRRCRRLQLRGACSGGRICI